MRPRLLDLFCGAGGAAMGYHRAGFEVVGVDLNPQPRYPFEFHQADALTFDIDGFDVIHASPPCQRYSTATAHPERHPDLLGQVRDRLAASGVPWIIENVPGAPIRRDITLCGSMFGLLVRRHRHFESNVPLTALDCDHRTQGQPWGVYGDGGGTEIARVGGGSRGRKASQSRWGELMGMPWATPQEIKEAIPPAYAEYIGRQLVGFA